MLRKELWHLRTGGLTAWRTHRWRVRADLNPRDARAGAAPGQYEPWPLPSAPQRRHDLRVAVILDDFSRLALGYEWQQVEITPADWRATLEAEPVDLLFVESAWHGNGGAWRYHLTGTSAPRPAVVELLQWCRDHGVPTVFWNKEDPVHHEDFLDVAQLFDRVLTTDGGLLDTYREELGHDRVGVLPFAAQPALHNPVRAAVGHQERDIAFAGMYFSHRHPERREQMDLLLGAAHAVSGRMETGLEIFSRQLGGDARYQFPAPLDSRVVGSLDYGRMLSAYRGYKVFLNVNTVPDSDTMCARRIFEITASGTPVVSTPSPAIDNVFGDGEVPQVADQASAESLLRALVGNPGLRDRLVHRAQRRVWTGHTYAHRVDGVLDAVGVDTPRPTAHRPSVTALVSTNRAHRLTDVIATVASQQEVQVQLALLLHGLDEDEARLRALAAEAGIEDVVVLSAEAAVPLGACLNRLLDVADGDVVAKIDDDDLYGPQYLSDQLYALDYSGADLVGKGAHYVHLVDADLLALRMAHHEHRFTDRVMGPTMVTSRELGRRLRFPEVSLGEDTAFLARVVEAGGRVYSADRFNFVLRRNGNGTAHTWGVSDAALLAGSSVEVHGFTPDHVIV
jgi:spore maturation protein CgeB